MKDSDLLFLALGGAGEIGMNFYLYGHGRGKKRRWIVVDCGIGFGDMETSPGVELVYADPAFALEVADKIEGVFLTHAHEDHIGGLAHIWDRLRCPVFCTSFTAVHVKRKFEERGLKQKSIKVVDGGTIAAGPFHVRFQPVTHSIPQASALVIDTPAGRIVHTGDFKVDFTPQMGDAFDDAAFRALGDEGVHALICDSTNVFLEGRGHSEAEVLDPLAEVIRQSPGAVAATTFASNVARLRSIALVARQCGRSIVLAGRAMQRMTEAAIDTGLLTDFPDVLSEDAAKKVPADHLLYLVTGSQGEQRAALARIASGSHPTISLGQGDTVVFSSKTIPGNEAGVARIANQLSELGVRVVEEGTAGRIHVSGHARRDDLRHMYELLRPKISVPMHGEHRHLVEHARLAEEWGVPSIAAPNGSITDISGDRPQVIDHVETGRVYVDGETAIGALDGVIRERLKLARQGVCAVSIVTDLEGELIADPEIKLIGGPERSDGWPATLEQMIYEAVDDEMEKAPRKLRLDDDRLEDLTAKAVRRACRRWWGKTPVVAVLITRVEDEEEG